LAAAARRREARRGGPAWVAKNGVPGRRLPSRKRGWPGRAAPWGPSAPGEASSDRRHLGLWKARPFARRVGSRPRPSRSKPWAAQSPRPRSGRQEVLGRQSSRPLRHCAHAGSSSSGRCGGALNQRQIGRESSGAVPLAASARKGSRRTESVEKASSARGIVVRLVCPCSVDWLQKSAGGVGPRKPFSVVAEDGGKGLARSGEPATGERAPRPGSRPSWLRDQRRVRKGSPPMEGVVDRESRRPSTGGGGSDLDRTDGASCALNPRERCPGGDATSEVSP
jgi:hypothetical protein